MTDFDHLDRESEHGLERVTRVLKENLDLILAAVFIAAGAFAVFSVDVEIPRFWQVAGLAAVLASPWGYFLAGKVLSVLHNPKHIYLVDLDARYLEGALYEFPFSDFRRIETRSGEMTQLTPNLYVAKDVDLEAGEVTGTWRGTLDDVELARALEAVYQCRGDLQEQAQRGFAIETSATVIVRNAVRDTTRTIMDTFQSGSLPDEGDGLEDAIESELEKFDLENRVEMDEDLSPDPSEAAEGVPDDVSPEDDQHPDPEVDTDG